MMPGPGRLLAALAFAMLASFAAQSAAQAQLKLEWGTEGYYRTRAVSVSNLAHEPRFQFAHPVTGDPIVYPDITSTSYITQRLRIQPTLRLENIAKLTFELTALDDILYGDNNALNTAPLFSTNGTNQYYLGGIQSDTVAVTRAWIEFQVPVGLMRVGRMPSHWGMGILSNGGGSGNWDLTSPKGEPRRKAQDYYFDDDFGDNHFGSNNDRILFATRPLTILKTIQKKADTSSNLLFAYAFDKLSEAPLLLGEPDRLTRPFGQQGFISRGAKEDDVNEHVFVLAYSDPDWDQIRYSDELKFGTYWVFRTQEEAFTVPSAGGNPPGLQDTGSLVWIADFWYRIRYGNWYSEAEVVHIGGDSTGGVPYPGPNIEKTADIWGGALRAGYMTEKWDAILELGHSSGDENLADGTFKQRPLHPDFNVGLILFEEIVRERSARQFGRPPFLSGTAPDGGRGFMSNGGVVNANYIMPKGRFRPGFAGLEVVGQVLIAFVDKWEVVSPNIFVCPAGYTTSDGGCKLSKLLGTEFDVAIKSRFANDLIDFSLEFGYLIFGDALKVSSRDAKKLDDPASSAFSVQARVAFVW